MPSAVRVAAERLFDKHNEREGIRQVGHIVKTQALPKKSDQNKHKTIPRRITEEDDTLSIIFATSGANSTGDITIAIPAVLAF